MSNPPIGVAELAIQSGTFFKSSATGRAAVAWPRWNFAFVVVQGDWLPCPVNGQAPWANSC